MKESFKGEAGQPLAQGFLLAVFNWIPLKVRIWLMEGLSQLLFAIDGRHRRIAERNLALAFGEKTDRERTQMARCAFRNMGRVMAEFSFTPRLNQGNLTKYLFFEGEENFYRAHEKGKGVLFLTAHFGNWEWMAAAFPMTFRRPCHVIVRPLDSRLLDGIVERLRTCTGNRTVPKEKSMGRILRLLRHGEAVGVLLDQNVSWQEGVFVNFFGEPACTNAGLALLALKTGASVLPVFNIRQADGRYRAVIGPEIPVISTGDKDSDVEKNTELFTSVIERYVRENPDHWFWLHQRWKTRPWQAKRMKGGNAGKLEDRNNGIMEEWNGGKAKEREID